MSVRKARASLPQHHVYGTEKTFCTVLANLPAARGTQTGSEWSPIFFRELFLELFYVTGRPFCRKASEMFGFCRFLHIFKRLWIKWVTDLFFSANSMLISEKWRTYQFSIKNEENQLRKFCSSKKKISLPKFWVWLTALILYSLVYCLVPSWTLKKQLIMKKMKSKSSVQKFTLY